jgi:hypothetical protein
MAANHIPDYYLVYAKFKILSTIQITLNKFSYVLTLYVRVLRGITVPLRLVLS